jgi:hypothetical protein
MGRGSKKQKQGRATSAAAAAEAAAEPMLPHEAAWRLLLGELWQPPEQQLVCWLLCCSRAMARFVHELCAGRVVARISRQPEGTCRRDRTQVWQRQVTARGEGYSTWLAKHARLLAELRLELWDEQDQYVAAGVLAAASLAGTEVPQRMTRSKTAVARLAAAAADGYGDDDEQADAQPQPLPLRSLALSNSSTDMWCSHAYGIMRRLLPSLAAACPQLTQLKLKGCFVAKGGQQQLATAFTALRQLRELSLEPPGLMAVPALELGTQLNKLRLNKVVLSAAGFSGLPPSLVELKYCSTCSALPAAGHLTALTRLECYSLDAGSNAPPSVQHLQVAWRSNPAVLHHLTRLRSLNWGYVECSLEQLHAAVSAIGPSLTSLDMRACADLDRALLSQRVSGPSLPLTGLTVSLESTSATHLGQWTGLTRLSLHVVYQETPQQVAQQLQQLTALRELVLCVSCFIQPQALVQPLVDAVVGMSTLRSLEFRGSSQSCLAAEQRAQLHGMTQLTQLKLVNS